MKIKIADTDRTPFWGIPEAEIHLSSENNDFLEVDYSVLTPYQQQTLWSAMKMKTLLVEDAESFEGDFRNMLKGYLEKRQEGQISQIRQVFGVDSSPEDRKAVEAVAKTKELKKVMEGSVSTLKRILPDYPAFDLGLALKVEQHGKNRKTVVKLISDLVTKQAQKSANRVDSPNAPTVEEFENRQIFKGADKRFLSNLSGVVESEVEEVTIGPGEVTEPNDNT